MAKLVLEQSVKAHGTLVSSDKIHVYKVPVTMAILLIYGQYCLHYHGTSVKLQ